MNKCSNSTMAINLSKKIQKMEDLAITKKSLDANGVAYLKGEVIKYMNRTGKRDIKDVLPIIVNYVFSMAFLEGVNGCIQILRERE